MRQGKSYAAEFGLVGATAIVGALGFWTVFFGQAPHPGRIIFSMPQRPICGWDC